ncbi:unnamed protein product [Aphanomyces euteiches]|uniref:Uncharacterized protein n=1 Tax=Aphanomyces euteiches TaxID=100861 RepID=A0A6G0WP15_9STRA|nr:hypothetical protein Ae201684_013106 [Aphanomyces euteiches]KAH9076352.1 hypothetical protein Ae201684P_010298 [Aphanomyces euteiches]
MNSIAFFAALLVVLLSAPTVHAANNIHDRFTHWTKHSGAVAAKRLGLLPPHAVNSSIALARFAAAASTPTESIALVEPSELPSWFTISNKERVALFQKAAKQGRVKAVATNDTTESSKIYLTIASSSASTFAFIPPCADPLCLKPVAPTNSTDANPFVTVSETELTDFVNTSITSGAVQPALVEVQGESVLVLGFDATS